MLEFLKQVDVLVALILGVGGALVSMAAWWDKRGRNYADSRVHSVVLGQGQTHERLQRLEGRVDEVEGGVDKVSERLRNVEGQINSLATAQQVADLRERMGKVEGVVEQVDGKVDTIYRAFTDPYRSGS